MELPQEWKPQDATGIATGDTAEHRYPPTGFRLEPPVSVLLRF